MKVLYTAKTKTVGGRHGTVQSSDGALDLKLDSPGSSSGATNPEQLFAAGYSACYFSALEHHAKEAGVDLSEASIDAEVDLASDDDGYFLQVRFHIEAPGVPADRLAALAQKAHETCPYSKATRGNVDVSFFVGDRPLAGVSG